MGRSMERSIWRPLLTDRGAALAAHQVRAVAAWALHRPSPTACLLRGYGRAGTQEDRLGESFPTVRGASDRTFDGTFDATFDGTFDSQLQPTT